MSHDTDAVGAEGEALAARFLITHGYRVVGRRVRTAYGEIDLVVERDDLIVFVEVKSRRSNRFGAPALAVDPRRAERLRNAALHLMSTRREWLGRRPRIDVVEVLFRSPGEAEIRHLEDAVGR